MTRMTPLFAGVALSTLAASMAVAQTAPPPPPPSGSPPPSSSSSSSSQPSRSGGGVGKAIVVGQIVSGACTVVVIAAHANRLGSGAYRRELTPLEAADDAARCGSFVGIIVSVVSRMQGLKDNACTYEIAHRAHLANNTPRAREELLWGRDGSDRAWQNRQDRFMAEYVVAYRHCAKKTKRTKRR